MILKTLVLDWGNSIKCSTSDDNDPTESGGVHCGNHPAVPRHHQPLHWDPQDPWESQQKVIPASQAFICGWLYCDNTDRQSIQFYIYPRQNLCIYEQINHKVRCIICLLIFFCWICLMIVDGHWMECLKSEDTKGNLLKQNQRHKEVFLTIGMTCFREAAEFPWV